MKLEPLLMQLEKVMVDLVGAVFNNTVKSQVGENKVLYRVSLPISPQGVMKIAESATRWKLKETLKIFMMTIFTTFLQGVLDTLR